MISAEQIVYLDNNATTQLDPAVIEEMLPFLTQFYGNPSSGYSFGRQVRQAIELARERVAGLLGCEPGEIVFTSCGTESNNAAVNSALQLDPALIAPKSMLESLAANPGETAARMMPWQRATLGV